MVALTKTRADLVTRALQKLSVIGAGQSADAEDSELVDSFVDSTLVALSSDRIVTVADEAAIPIDWFESIAELLAYNAATDFGRPKDEVGKLAAETRLRRMVASDPTYEVQRATYF
jgi:hypothetical protein